jgi:hypothetical protein
VVGGSNYNLVVGGASCFDQYFEVKNNNTDKIVEKEQQLWNDTNK